MRGAEAAGDGSRGWEPGFRAEVRAFVGEHLPAEARERLEQGRRLGRDEIVAWQRALDRRGWAAPGWPVEHGGTGWPLYQQHVFAEELALAPAPEPLSYNIRMLGPILIAAGTPAQQARFLPRIRRLDDWWCQGFSEPDAGSDLASLRTRAVLRGDRYVVNGHKTWISLAHWADWMFCLVRTDPAAPRKQLGISFLLVDLRAPGVTVRPIMLANDEPEVCDVFLDDVEVPAANLVGEAGRGWSDAKLLLEAERVGIAAIGRSKFLLDRLRRLLASTGAAAHGHDLADRVAFVEAELLALEATQLRALAGSAADAALAAPLLKLKGTEIAQALTSLSVEALGLRAVAFPHGADARPLTGFAAGAVSTYLYERATTIFGGSSEIQKDILARTALGLP
jgi:alkylation response protein AidB-like acyl-CoA dehydrogenase